MKISNKHRRALGLASIILLFIFCSLAVGIKNALSLSLLLLIPIGILMVGVYFAVKNNGNRIRQNLWISSSIGIAFSAFTFIGGIIDPKNKSPLGTGTLFFALLVGLCTFIICMVFAIILSGKKEGPK